MCNAISKQTQRDAGWESNFLVDTGIKEKQPNTETEGLR